jgi:hypothetical protein
MQAAVLIFSGEVFKKQVEDSNANWAKHLREVGDQNLPDSDDPAFFGDYSLISTDQGVRGFLFSINDLCFVESAELELEDGDGRLLSLRRQVRPLQQTKGWSLLP